MSTIDSYAWQLEKRGTAHAKLFEHARRLEREQFAVYQTFRRCEALYDTRERPSAARVHRTPPASMGRMHENVIASNVDTLAAQVATADIRAVWDSDGADWSTQRKLKWMEWYFEGLGKQLGVKALAAHTFKHGGEVKGTGLVKGWIDRWGRIQLRYVPPDDIVIDEYEARNGVIYQFYHRDIVDRDRLAAEHPECADKIRRAQQSGAGRWAMWAGYRPLRPNEVVVLEGWYYPIGVRGRAGYVPGRHIKAIDGHTLVDEDWHDEAPPFAVLHYTRASAGWFGIGMVERIAGIQLALNRRNLQMERKLDHGAYPTTWVQQADNNIASQQASIVQNALGTVAVYRGSRPPETVTPPAISPEELRDAERLAQKANEVSGVSRMAAQSVKPAGIETGVALREYRDQTTQRFAEQEQTFERFVLDIYLLLFRLCKELGDRAPVIVRPSKVTGDRKIDWKSIDLGEAKVMIGAATTLSRTRAGRLQTVVELAQAGLITQDEARRLQGHPDLDRAMSLYDAAIDVIEEAIEAIADGHTVMPEPYMNLKLTAWRATQQYLLWWRPEDKGGPTEEVLENLRMLIVNAAWMGSGAGAAPAADGTSPMPGAPGPGPDAPMQMPMGPDGMPPMPPGGLPVGPPMGPPPVAALAPQAMMLAPQ